MSTERGTIAKRRAEAIESHKRRDREMEKQYRRDLRRPGRSLNWLALTALAIVLIVYLIARGWK